ncbi:MAG: CopG family transcriptional regulator [Candidatus Aminicenantes bacterium]|nr:MAG: CopG family transcriptional regulator [Candidatus Aminicenantes bacterium]HDJ23585.1 CopG family transcriptional regulator [Candidatus Aminicenantes bacterium]
MIMTKEFTQITIPTNLYQQLEEKIKGTEYASVASYVTKVLKEHLEKSPGEKEAFTSEEEEKVKERLKALGYID